VSRTPLRIVSALLLSVLFTVPVLGAVCTMLCEPVPVTRAHYSHSDEAPQSASGDQHVAHHAHDANTVSEPAHHHHAPSPSAVPDTRETSAEWNGHCCDEPALTLAAIPAVRHELQVKPDVFRTMAVDSLSGGTARPADLRRDASRPLSPLGQSNPVLRI
jgi:hypothetical protein